MSETKENVYLLPFLGEPTDVGLKLSLAPRLLDRFGIKEFEIAKWEVDDKGKYHYLLRPQDTRMGIRIVVVRYSAPATNQPALP